MQHDSQTQDLCAVCGGQLRKTTITHEERRGGRLYLFENVPAQVCDACGEVWLDEGVLQEIEQLIENGEPVRQINTQVFDLALHH